MIAFTNISKQYGRQILFVETAFQLNPGEKVGLVGPNGSGKTTLFRMITGEEQPDEGDVFDTPVPAGTPVEVVKVSDDASAPDTVVANTTTLDTTLPSVPVTAVCAPTTSLFRRLMKWGALILLESLWPKKQRAEIRSLSEQKSISFRT